MKNDRSRNAMAISISRNNIPLIAIAVLITSDDIIIITGFSDISKIKILLQQILLYNPAKILIEECQKEYIDAIHKTFDLIEICPLDRAKFCDNDFERFQKNTCYNFIDKNYFLKTGLMALVNYFEVDCSKVKIVHKTIENRLIMDIQTIFDLNIVKTNINTKNLFDTLDHTHTTLGKQLLRENIIQPYADLEVIKSRQDVIKYLRGNIEIAEALDKLLASFKPLQSIMRNSTMILNGSLKDQKKVAITVINIYKLVCSIENLCSFCCKYHLYDIQVFNNITNVLELHDTKKVKDIIGRYLKIEYLDGYNQITIDLLVKSVKTTLDPFLKLAVDIYTENINDLYDEISKIKLELPECELHYDAKFGYTARINQKHIKCKEIEYTNQKESTNDYRSKKISHSSDLNKDYSLLPPYDHEEMEFSSCSLTDTDLYTLENRSTNTSVSKTRKRQKKVNDTDEERLLESLKSNKSHCNLRLILIKKTPKHYLFTTSEFEKINFRTLESIEQVFQISFDHHVQAVKDLAEFLENLSVLSDWIAEIDVCNSLFNFSKLDDSCLPCFGDSVIVSNTYHLLTEKRERVNNNIYTSPKMFFNIVTGMNMSGKTTYMKMIAQSVILAQIGAPLRGQTAKMKMCNQILTRLSHDEILMSDKSTFENEVYSVKEILESANSNSLVLLDEVGRGTNYHDGLSFALFVCEELINKKCFTYFTTHFNEIIKYIKTVQGVNVIKCQRYSIRSGLCEQTNGIEICSGYFPEKVLSDAKEIKKTIFGQAENIQFNNQAIQLALKIMGCITEEEKNELMKQLRG